MALWLRNYSRAQVVTGVKILRYTAFRKSTLGSVKLFVCMSSTAQVYLILGLDFVSVLLSLW